MQGYSWITSPIPISPILLLCITIGYLLCRYYAYRPIFSLFDIALNYIPVLTHEFGHVLFNRLSGGRVLDFVVVATRSERNATGQQGYAVTQSRSRSGQIFTTIGGYIMPPLMFTLGLYFQSKGQGALYILIYVLIFIYFTWKTSRKWVPLLLIVFLVLISYLGIQSENLSHYSVIYMLVYHVILGTLLGEMIQSSITIVQLTFARPQPDWDGTALKMLTKLPTFIFSAFWVFVNFWAMYYFIQHTFS